MKEYICPLSVTGKCRYGGNKAYNYGFVKGTASYCRYSKRWIHDIERCPIPSNIETEVAPQRISSAITAGEMS